MRINILTNSRSGSNYLFHVFRNNFPDYEYALEPNSDRIAKEISEYPWHLKFLKEHNIPKIEVDWSSDNIITKNMIFQQQPPGDWYTIRLIRKNLFEQTLSATLAVTSKNFLSRTNEVYEIEVDRFVRYAKYLKEQNEILENTSSDDKIYYEELTFDPKTDLERLGFELNNKITPIPKLTDKKQTIINYDELRYIFDKEIFK